MPYIGSGPEIDNVSLKTFSGDGSTVAFDLVTIPNSDNQVLVFVGGEIQHDWTRSTSTVTFTTAPPTGTDNVNIYIVGKPVNIGTPSDGTVTTDKIVDDAVDYTKVAPGMQIGYGYTQDGASNTGTTLMVFDNTIPQSTEGDEYMTLAYTPKEIGSKLLITAKIHFSHSTTTSALGAALFKDSDTDSISAALSAKSTLAASQSVVWIEHEFTTTALTAITFKVRAGGSTAGTTTFNNAIFNGTMNSYMKIIEIKQ